MITHVFFDLHGTLVDATGLLLPCYNRALGALLAGRYGGDPADWAEAHRRVLADWDSYYADLDLSGDDGLAHMWEGQTRTLRALFRLTVRPYPPPDEMACLVREHHYLVTSQCDALYPDAHKALRALHAMPLTLGVISNAVVGHAEGCLVGAGVREWFQGPIIGPEVIGYFGKDAACFRFAFARASVPPERCAVVDDHPAAMCHARQSGARAVLVDRARRHGDDPGGADAVLPDLSSLPDLLRQWRMEAEDDRG